MTRSDPSAVRWLVGVELRDRRQRARMTAAAAAKLIGTNHSKIVHMETGRYRQRPEEVTALLSAYGAPASEVERVGALAAREDGPSWWEPWRKVVSDDFGTFLGLEGMADKEFRCNPLIMPSLFQTEAYALAVTIMSRRVPLDLQEMVVELRMERQRRLLGDSPLKVHAVIEESVLHRVADGAEVMREQLSRMIELSELPNVIINILPTARGLRAATCGDFNMVELASGRQIVYVESLYGNEYVHDRNDVRGYTLMVDSVVSDALDETDSIALIKKVITETT